MTMRSHVSSFLNVCGPSFFQYCRLHFTFTALDTIWTLLYHTMLKFRPYHKFWCFNEKLPMIFHFWCIPSHVFICSFELCEKVNRKKKSIVKISNLSTKRVVRKCSDCVIGSVYVHTHTSRAVFHVQACADRTCVQYVWKYILVKNGKHLPPSTGRLDT